MSYEHNTLWSKFRVIAASDSQSICALRYAWATRKLHTICCLHERDFVLGLSRRWNRPRVSDHERERLLHRVARNYNRHRKSQVLLKPHLHGRLLAARIDILPFFFLKSRRSLKPHLHGRLLAARIDIVPFFFLKSRRSLTRRKIHVWFCLRDIARHAPRKIKSQQSLTRERF